MLLFFVLVFWACDFYPEPGEPPPDTPPGPGVTEDAAGVKVDFSKKQGVPLLKRQNTFSPSGLFINYYQYFSEAWKLLRAMGPESMRIDLLMGMGGLAIGRNIGTGTPGSLSSDFGDSDMVIRKLIESGVMPYLIYCYTPQGLQNPAAPSTKWNYPPLDYDAWKDICYAMAKHYRDLGLPLAAHELWNEPDLATFWTGSWNDYLKLYDYGARGIRAADPWAKIGGPSVAFIQNINGSGRLKQFLDYVRDRGLPLDFLSYHSYGTALYRQDTATAINALSQYGGAFSTAELHITEFSVCPPGTWVSENTAVSAIAPLMCEAIDYFVNTPQVTNVNWASFLAMASPGSKLDMVSGSAKRYAPYHVLAVYNNMPIERVSMEFRTAGIKGFASGNESRGGALLYNTDTNPVPASVVLLGLPFDNADSRVYLIDSEHSNYYETGKSDGLECIFEALNVHPNGFAYSGELPPLSVMYIEAIKHGESAGGFGAWSLDGGTPVAGGKATVVKKYYWFPDRSKSAYAEFDLASFTAYAGMGGAGGVLLSNAHSFAVTMDSWNVSGGTRFFKVDHLDLNGQTVSSELFYNGSAVSPSLPWSPNPPSVTTGISGGVPFMITPGVYGALISYGIVNSGPEAMVRFRVE
jgi:hypothetical protein